MASGRGRSVDELPARARSTLIGARRAVLATVDAGGRAHVVPVCFALRGAELISAIDPKPKRATRLARVRNIERTGRATLLADHYEEDWERLGWVMVEGAARLEDIGDGAPELRDKYPQYRAIGVGEGLIVISPERILWWTYS